MEDASSGLPKTSNLRFTGTAKTHEQYRKRMRRRLEAEGVSAEEIERRVAHIRGWQKNNRRQVARLRARDAENAHTETEHSA